MNIRSLALAACVLVTGSAHAQPAGKATCIIEVADPVLAPGQSTGVTVRVAYDPGIGHIINSGNLSGPVKWLWTGEFDIIGSGAPGVTGSWSGNTLDPPYDFFMASPGTNAGLNVHGVLWGMPTLLIHPNPANPETVWTGVFTAGAGSEPGVVALDISAHLPTWVMFSAPLLCEAQYLTSPGPGAGITIVCYADCDMSGALTIADFGCFQSKFVAQEAYADCNQNGTFTIADFGCFQAAFAKACP